MRVVTWFAVVCGLSGCAQGPGYAGGPNASQQLQALSQGWLSGGTFQQGMAAASGNLQRRDADYRNLGR